MTFSLAEDHKKFIENIREQLASSSRAQGDFDTAIGYMESAAEAQIDTRVSTIKTYIGNFFDRGQRDIRRVLEKNNVENAEQKADDIAQIYKDACKYEESQHPSLGRK